MYSLIMTLRHLKVFLAVFHRQSMTKAAADLGMAQPPVSQAVAELEAHYGTLLFERRGRGVVPTPAGQLLATYASHVTELVDEARTSLRDLTENGDLRVGASQTTGAEILPRACRFFLEEFPRADLRLQVDNTARIAARLQAAELDLALVEGRVDDDRIVLEPLADDELVLVCPPGHPWTLRGRIAAADLDGGRFFVREPGSGTREAFEAALESRGLGWKAAGEIAGTPALLALVSEGLGCAFLSSRAVRDAAARGRVAVVGVEGFEIRRRFSLAIHGSRLVTPALEAFSRAARRAANSSGP